ncbi:MAG: shikimate kinase [Chlamydiota bacterium]
MNIILFGFKKCGKTYYGLKVAQKLHMHFVDSDLLLEQHYHKIYHQNLSYREIAKKHGFPFFRNLEKHVVSLLVQQKNSIISLGGGVVLDQENVIRLEKSGVMVYLKLSKETLEHRLLSSEPPAYIDSKDPISSFNAMYEERLPIYEAIDAHIIDIEGLSEEEIVHKICLFIEEVKEKNNGEQ